MYVSGSYYNEVVVDLKDHKYSEGLAGILEDVVGMTFDEITTGYSWNTGVVIVPAYDSQADAEEVTTEANIALIPGGVSIVSWQTK